MINICVIETDPTEHAIETVPDNLQDPLLNVDIFNDLSPKENLSLNETNLEFDSVFSVLSGKMVTVTHFIKLTNTEHVLSTGYLGSNDLQEEFKEEL